MKLKPIIPRIVAQRDVEDAIDYYLNEASEQVALGFIAAIEQAYTRIARHPATGSTRYAHELDLPELRSWPVKRHPFLIFYVSHADRIDVWRILHSQRDIPSWLREEG